DQRVIAFAPVVADARFTVHDQRIDAQLRQARGDRKSGLSPADDEHRGVAVVVLRGGLAQVEPVGSVKIARIGLALRPWSSEPFLVSLHFVKRRQQRPGLERVAVIGIARESQHAAAATLARFKAENGFDRIGAGAPHIAGRGPTRIDLKTSRTGPVGVRCKLSQNRIRTVDRLDVPGEGQHVAPKAVRMKQRLEARAPWRCERSVELLQPTLRNRRDGVCSGQQWRSPAWLRQGNSRFGPKLAYSLSPTTTIIRWYINDHAFG